MTPLAEKICKQIYILNKAERHSKRVKAKFRVALSHIFEKNVDLETLLWTLNLDLNENGEVILTSGDQKSS